MVSTRSAQYTVAVPQKERQRERERETTKGPRKDTKAAAATVPARVSPFVELFLRPDRRALTFLVDELVYHAGDVRDMREDGLFGVIQAWFEIEGAPVRGHKAAVHSFNSINKHAGLVRVRTVHIEAKQGKREEKRVPIKLHALFGDSEDAWVFEELRCRTDPDQPGDMSYVGRLDATDVDFVLGYEDLGCPDKVRANFDEFAQLETALYGA